MRTFICGLHPRGAASQSGLGVGDLLVKVGEVTVWDRCHLNVTTIIKNLSSMESVSVTVLRNSSHLGHLSVRPVTHYPLLLDDMVSMGGARRITRREKPFLKGCGTFTICQV